MGKSTICGDLWKDAGDPTKYNLNHQVRILQRWFTVLL